jgi:hypothetical protein
MPSTSPAACAARLIALILLLTLAPSLRAGESAPDLNQTVSLVPTGYRHELVQRLSVAEGKRDAWLNAIVKAPEAQREAIAFLLVNMPERDLKSLSPDFILTNTALAYEARAAHAWAATVPHDIFLNDVLPYSNLNEKRDNWRADFARRFGPLVKDCKSAGDAALLLNREIFKALNVVYHATKRPKPDQSPYESMEAGFASCSGLSILLVDACRAVGVPARVAGTPMWSDGKGNHTWVEVWDGQWRFIGAAEPGEFNQTWFAANAAKADAANPEHRIYAASFRRTKTPFILVWDPTSTEYSAVDVTAYYVAGADLAKPPTTQPVATAGSELDGDWAKMKAIVPRGYVCRRAPSRITIDGKPDKPVWGDAPWTADFVDIEGDRRPVPRFRTRARMMWDDDNLYIFAELQEPHVWGTITKRNEVMFADNDFEVFLCPSGTHHNYYEFEMNALNSIWELTLPKPYRDGGQPINGTNIPGLRSAVHINGTLNDPSDTDRSWCVELAIPWKGLARYADGRAVPPKDGEQWRANFSRVEWLVDILDGAYRKIPKETRAEDNWVWSPTGVIDMHRPERWGHVQFSSTAATADFRPDPTLATRDALMAVYYRQRTYREKFGHYAPSANELGITEPGIQISPTATGYVATSPPIKLPDGSMGSFHLQEDSKIKQETSETASPKLSVKAGECLLPEAAMAPLKGWLARPENERPPLTNEPFANVPLTRQQADRARQLLWDDHVAEVAKARADEWKSQAVTIGDHTLKWKQRQFGQKPKDGWNLYISLHGGGNAPAPVNDQQWENQIKLYQPKDSLYIAPRAPTNTWNLWHEPHMDGLLARLIEDATILGGVNPNRVYIMGYSAGGDGVYQLAPRLADRWAAAAMMAGHPNDASPLGLRNIGFTAHVGALDGAYDRNKIAAKWGGLLDDLRKDDPEGYVHEVKIHEGRSHWMNLEDAVAIDWMARFTRNPFPKKVVWKQSPVTHGGFYWLAIPPGEAKAGQLVVASYSGQTIRIEKSENVAHLTVLLNDAMIDLDQPIRIVQDQAELFAGRVPRTMAHLRAALVARGELAYLFPGSVTVALTPR